MKYFLDWCPTKETDYGAFGVDLCFSDDALIQFIAEKIYIDFDVRLNALDCVGRSDGLLVMGIEYSDAADEMSERLTLRIERYAMRKFKERLLNHRHVFHNSALSGNASHNPIVVSTRSMQESLPADLAQTMPYAAMDDDALRSILSGVASSDSILSKLKAARKDETETETLAVEVLFSFLIGKTFEAHVSINKILDERKRKQKDFHSERRRAVIISLLLMSVVAIVFKIALQLSGSNLIIVGVAALATAYLAWLERSRSTSYFKQARRLATNAIGYAFSARYYSTIADRILRENPEYSTDSQSIRDSKADFTTNSLGVIVAEIQQRVEGRRFDLTLLLTGIGVVAAIFGVA